MISLLGPRTEVVLSCQLICNVNWNLTDIVTHVTDQKRPWWRGDYIVETNILFFFLLWEIIWD